MHERTQRAIARMLFVFCCAVPTAITILCMIITWTPWYHHRSLRALEDQLSEQIGMVVRIDDFERDSPRSIQLNDVKILNPESLEEVLRVREVHWFEHPDSIAIELHWPKLRSSQLEDAWKLVHDRFLLVHQRTRLPVRLAAKDLTVEGESGAITLRDVGAWLRPNGKSVEAKIECIPANHEFNAPVAVTVVRDRNLRPAATRWMLETGSTPLPCSVLADYLPMLGGLGSEAEFIGTMRWQSTAKDYFVDLGGSQFRKVALDRLFENQPHRLSGLATIQFTHCHINPSDGRSDIVGTVRATHGLVGRSLIQSAVQNFGFDVPLVPEGHGDVPYDLMAFGFNIDNALLAIEGICRNEPGQEGVGAGVVLCRDGVPYVRSTGQELYAVDALNLISSGHAVRVPLSGQTRWLANVLIPPSRGPSAVLSRDPAQDPAGIEPRIRAARRYQGGELTEQPDSSVRSGSRF